MVAIFSFTGGAIFGSFLNMLLWRLPKGLSINGRSRCRACDAVIAWYDLIPVLSFFLLQGRCRQCKHAIHHRYPLVEFACGFIVASFFSIANPTPAVGLVSVIGLLILLALFFFDLFYFLLPDAILIPAIIGFIIYALAGPEGGAAFLLSGLFLAAFFAILYLMSRGSQLGFGDVKLAGLLGLMFGYPWGALIVIVGTWIGGLAAVIMLAKGASRKKELPFGSFLALAAIIFIIFNDQFIRIFATYF